MAGRSLKNFAGVARYFSVVPETGNNADNPA